MSAVTDFLRGVRKVGVIVARPARRLASWSMQPLRRRIERFDRLAERAEELLRDTQGELKNEQQALPVSAENPVGRHPAEGGGGDGRRHADAAPADLRTSRSEQPDPRASSHDDDGRWTSPPSSSFVKPAANRTWSFRDEALAGVVAGIATEAARISGDMVRREFRRMGGWDDRRINVPAMVGELGMAKAVELSQHCSALLSAGRLDYVLRPDEAARSSQLLRVMESRGWVRRHGMQFSVGGPPVS